MRTSIKEHSGDDTCEMVANDFIDPFSEIYNTYGEELTNAQLLVRYGFTLDSNENDIISWNKTDLHRVFEFTLKGSRDIGNVSAGGGDLSSLKTSDEENKSFLVFDDFERQAVERSASVITREDQDSFDHSLGSGQARKDEKVEDQGPILSWVEVLLERLDLALTRWSGGWDDFKKSALIYIPKDRTNQEKEGQNVSHEGYMRQGFSSSGSGSDYVRNQEIGRSFDNTQFPVSSFLPLGFFYGLFPFLFAQKRPLNVTMNTQCWFLCTLLCGLVYLCESDQVRPRFFRWFALSSSSRLHLSSRFASFPTSTCS